MADLMLDFGSYNKFENYYMSNGTQTFYTLIWANFALKEKDPLKYFEEKIKYSRLSVNQYKIMQGYFKEILHRLELTNMNRKDKDLIKSEIKQSVDLITNIQKINLSFDETISRQERIKLLEEVINSTNGLILNHQNLWLERNRSGGLKNSVQIIENLVAFAKIQLQDLIIRGEEK